MTKKLEETFGIDEYLKEDEYYNLELPDEANIDVVTRLALEAYKAQMESIQHIEPKYRSRAFEVAEHYLRLVKDALIKKEELEQKQKKIDMDSGGKGKEEKNTKQSRTAILTEINERRKAK